MRVHRRSSDLKRRVFLGLVWICLAACTNSSLRQLPNPTPSNPTPSNPTPDNPMPTNPSPGTPRTNYWEAIGGAFESDGGPAIYTTEDSDLSIRWLNKNTIFTGKLNGENWSEPLAFPLPTRSNNETVYTTYQITIDKNGYPLVVYGEQNGGTYRVYVERWNGNAWTQLGDASITMKADNNYVYRSRGTLLIAIDETNNAVVAWQESDGTLDISNQGTKSTIFDLPPRNWRHS
jgi:hypothetical protein